jgi:hypothetical protein
MFRSVCERAELLIERGNSLLEHAFVRRRGGAGEVGQRPRARQLERPPLRRSRALFIAEDGLSLLLTRRLFLLRLDRFRFPSAGHGFYQRTSLSRA